MTSRDALRRYRIGSLLLWGSVPLALVMVSLVERLGHWTAAGLGLCLVLALVGAGLKRRYCPKCQSPDR